MSTFSPICAALCVIFSFILFNDRLLIILFSPGVNMQVFVAPSSGQNLIIRVHVDT